MMAMDDTIEVVGTTHTDAVKGMASLQDGSVTEGKKKRKKKRHPPMTTELPPLRQQPNVALELHQLSGMKRGKMPPLVIENSVAVKEESVSQESDNGGLPTTSVSLPAHLANDIPRSKFETVTVVKNGSTLTGDATLTKNLMSRFENVATETMESGKSIMSDKLNSTGSCDSHLSQARLKRRTTRRETKLASSQLLSTDVTSTVEMTPTTPTHSLRPLPADPVLTSKDGNTHRMETHDDRLHDAEGNRVRSTKNDGLQDTESDTSIMGITVHGTDCLVPDVRLIHPLIQLHIVDMAAGNYLKKSDKLKSAVSYYENLNENVDHIIPLQTQPAYYPNGIRRDLSVSWEEQLVINEHLSYFTDNPNTILIFELLDFSKNMEVFSEGSSLDSGWYRVAWAFLKLVGGHGNPNTYKKCRLQLYQYPHQKRRQQVTPQFKENSISVIQIYRVWNSMPRTIYPSTLYVTIKGVCPPPEAFAVQRSMLPQQPEEANVTYEELLQKHHYKKDITKVSHDSLATRTWKRLPGQTCQMPNHLMHMVSAGRMGCTTMAFSHSGCHLAACCYENAQECTVVVYSIPDCKDHMQLVGHHGIIYHAHWSHDDTHLLTASQDTTVRHWDLSCRHHIVLPHACFVYDAIYHYSVDHVILTAGYDQLIYIWTVHSTESRYGQCLHKLSGHHGYINTLCFGGEGHSLFSADSTGVICRWVCPSSHDAMSAWKFDQTLTLPELQDHVITSLQLQPTNHNRLLISTQKGKVFLMDTRVLHIIHCYHDNSGIQNNQSVTIFSACGTYVLLTSGHCLTVCRVDNSTVVGRYQNLPLHHPITSLLFHPLDHVIALSAFGDNEPIFLYNYSKDETEGGVVDLLEPPVSEEATPLPSSHDVLVQSTRLHKALNRLALVTQQSINGPDVVSGLESTLPSSVAASTGTLPLATPSEFTSNPTTLHMPYSSTPQLLMHSSNAPTKAVALFDYAACRPIELSVHRGSQLMVLNRRDPQWWLCTVGDKEGYIPSSYVVVEQTTSPLAYKSASLSLDHGINFQQEVSGLSKSAVTVKGKKKVKHKLP